MAVRRDDRIANAPRITLEMPVQFLKGVGERRAQLLRKLGIETAGDLLRHVPHRYEDASTIAPIVSVAPGMDVTVMGRVISKGVLPTRKGLRIFQAVVQDASGLLEVSWPGQPFLDRTIEKGDVLLLTGPVRFYHGRQLQPREFVNLGAEDSGSAHGRVLSVYPATEGMTARQLRVIIELHLDALLALVPEHLPERVRVQAGVLPIGEALRMVHRPTSVREAAHGRDRLAFDELLFVQLLHRRANALAREPRRGIVYTPRRTLTSRLRTTLPFALTGAQTRALKEIVADMCSPRRMHRLLQGDVGSGKTVVALFAALLAVENGFQAAVMAPTELLAEQHARTLETLLAPLEMRPLLVTGRLGAAERRRVDERLASSAPLVAIGTHALVQEKTQFGKLGLAVIDEQHRFGVAQRLELRRKLAAQALEPHLLMMSATPIPRTLAMTYFADLDVSTLDELPPGRTPIVTRVFADNRRDEVIARVRDAVGQGRQVYWVVPLIEESEALDLQNATETHAQLAATFEGTAVGLLHGRMNAADKAAVMAEFTAGRMSVLVATTVIEVGVDVPNASVMVIEHAERFGLAQLHQLRGRVGRGAVASVCVLLYTSPLSQTGRERLKAMAETTDGFEIARRDLEIRGPGEFMGARQSGDALLRFADLATDQRLLERARSVAPALLDRHPAAAQAHISRWLGGKMEFLKA